jgi:hypothetical protein
MTTEELARKFVETLEGIEDPADLGTMFDDDVTYWVLGTTPVSGVRSGKKNFLDFLASEAPLFRTQITWKINNTYVGPDWFIVEAQGDCTTRAGERYQNSYCMVFKVRGGKIVTFRNYLDTELCRQVMCKGINHIDDVARLPPVT